MRADRNTAILRPYTPEDLHGVVQMLNLAEREITGKDFTSPEDFSADMVSSGFDYRNDTAVIVIDTDHVIAYAEVFADKDPAVRLRGYGRVHPDFRGRGYGTRLIHWSETHAQQLLPKAPPEARVVLHQSTYAGQTDAIELLKENGYQYVRSSYRMLVDLDDYCPLPQTPEGISLRPIQNTEADLRAALWVDHQAFIGHWGHIEEDFEEYVARFKQRLKIRPQIDLSACWVAVAGETLVGLSICSLWTEEDADKGWVNILGVLKPWRKRGVGRALLLESFAELKRRGRKRAGLFVDAGNRGALNLYFQAGMRVEQESQIFEKELQPGIDLMAR